MMNFIFKYRIPIIIIGTIITVFFAYNIKFLKKNAGIETMLPQNNPDYKYFKEIEKEFGNMDNITIGISAKDSIYSREAITAINEITSFFENREEIEDDEVLSITTAKNIDNINGELTVEKLIDDPENITDEELKNVKFKIDDNPLYHGKLVSMDDKSTIIIANVPTEISLDEVKLKRLTDALYAKSVEVKNKYKDIEIYVSGFAVSKAKLSEFMSKDLKTLFPVALIVVMLSLLIILKQFKSMIIPIIVTIVSIIWTLGLKALLKSPVTISEIAIPVMLISICCADGIHIITEFIKYLREGYTTREALSKTMKILTTPVILTSITTAFGFLSLLTSPSSSLRSMGFFLSFGVIVAMFFSLYLIPSLISFYRSKKIKIDQKDDSQNKKQYKSLSNKLFTKWANLITIVKLPVIIFSVLITIISIIGFIMVKVDNDPVQYFYKTNDFRIATEHINKTMGGIADLYIIFEGTEENSMKDPVILKKMWDLQKYTETLDKVSFTFGLTDYIRQINYIYNNSDERYRRLPSETEKIENEKVEIINGKETITKSVKEVSGKDQVANLLLLYEMGGGETLKSIVNNDYSKAIVHVRIKNTKTEEVIRIINKLDLYIKNNFNNNGVKIKFSNQYIRYVITTLISSNQIINLFTTIIAVGFLLIIIFRSVLSGIVMVIPTFLAIIFNFLIMWLFGVPLDITTSTIASVGIGVGIDYSIHFFQRFKYHYLQLNDYTESVKKTIIDSGKPIMSNALAVGLGFAVLMFSNFKIIFDLGWIVAFSMLSTALNALIVLPVLIIIIKPKVKNTILPF
jgi:predicted RND superfamily exporter protein